MEPLIEWPRRHVFTAPSSRRPLHRVLLFCLHYLWQALPTRSANLLNPESTYMDTGIKAFRRTNCRPQAVGRSLTFEPEINGEKRRDALGAFYQVPISYSAALTTKARKSAGAPRSQLSLQLPPIACMDGSAVEHARVIDANQCERCVER